MYCLCHTHLRRIMFPMYVESVPNRNSPPAILLREASRVDGKIVKRTLANLSRWPAAQIDALRRVLKRESLVSPADAFQILRSFPHGHVAAALGTLRRLGLESILSRSRGPQRDLAVAMIVARILEPASKLATARGFHPETPPPRWRPCSGWTRQSMKLFGAREKWPRSACQE